MLKLGKTARLVRERNGLTQRNVAEILGISVVHLCNIENNKAGVSDVLISKYRQRWNVDLYILAWCLHGDVEALPINVRGPARQLAQAWKQEYAVSEDQSGNAHAQSQAG